MHDIFPLLYGIFLPISIAIGFAVVAVIRYKKYMKTSSKKNPLKRILVEVIACVVVSCIGIMLALYGSGDLIFHDYISVTAIYDGYNRGREVYIHHIYFFDGDNDYSCNTFSFTTKDLKEGRRYKFVYGKRTRMLISVQLDDAETHE